MKRMAYQCVAAVLFAASFARQPVYAAPSSDRHQAIRTITLRKPHKHLLEGSKQVARLTKRFRDYCWLSPTRVLLVWDDRDFYVYNSDSDYVSSWTSWAEVLDITTGRKTKMRGLTRDLRRTGGVPGKFRLSPGGKWLEWTYAETGDGWPIPAATRLDGSGFQRAWGQDKFSETGWLNDHTWIEIGARSGFNTPDKYVTIIHDLIRQSDVSLRSTSIAAARVAARVYQISGGQAHTGGTADSIQNVWRVDSRTAAVGRNH